LVFFWILFLRRGDWFFLWFELSLWFFGRTAVEAAASRLLVRFDFTLEFGLKSL